ncbi:secretory carrier-associated membrane protein 4-like isoform X2 [Rhododendron vialii]|uniref:secretory carrier-associated membrane protein 4-like isoform X2 n=1 Tax=Rhododendron vialii TaxID=182163 RepID=UPI0026600BAB|nr:secretory carrier-associated membrane protein 4-like isoform X2 [Rhododendron vialii]
MDSQESNLEAFPLPPEPAGFNYDRDAPNDFPLDTTTVCATSEVDKDKRTGIVLEDKKWPPFFSQIIQNDILVHLPRLAYVAFSTLLGSAVLS